jgi:adenine deaminase
MIRRGRTSKFTSGCDGEIKADLVITGGKLINLYSAEVLEGCGIAVVAGRSCYIGTSAKHTVGEATKVMDAKGSYISPAFIDGHTHIGHYVRPSEHLSILSAAVTTAVVASR